MVINGHKYTIHKEINTFHEYTSNWQTSDGDLVEVYIDKKEDGQMGGVRFNPFSGIPSSSFYINELDFSYFFGQNCGCEVCNMTYLEKSLHVADIVLSKFCEYYNESE